MTNKQTAVEWLVEQMRLRRDEGLSLSFYDLEMFAKKAKQMEKEQIETAYKEAYDMGYDHGLHEDEPEENGEKIYYTQTFKSE